MQTAGVSVQLNIPYFIYDNLHEQQYVCWDESGGVSYVVWFSKVVLSPWPSLHLHLPDSSWDEGSLRIENAGHICLSGIRLFLKNIYRWAYPISLEVTERCG